jgi:hypothetical protein
MSHRAHVWLQGPGEKTAKDIDVIGVIEVNGVLKLHAHVKFAHRGSIGVGRIDSLDLSDSKKRRVDIPRIVIVQGEGE